MRTANICPTCATYINSICVIYDGDTLTALNLPTGTPVGDIITAIDNEFIAVENAINQKQPVLGYTPENIANKVDNFDSPDNTTYPTTQAVQDQLDLKQDVISGHTGSVTISGTTLNFTNGILISIS